jgi:hypothetical protein
MLDNESYADMIIRHEKEEYGDKQYKKGALFGSTFATITIGLFALIAIRNSGENVVPAWLALVSLFQLVFYVIFKEYR